jgi:hypothetical protein
MGYVPRQTGWSQEAILLQIILKQIINLGRIAGGSVTPVIITTTTSTSDGGITTTTSSTAFPGPPPLEDETITI